MKNILNGKLANRTYNTLGKANDSEITTATIALFKMIFVPLTTLSDKKASKKQRHYTATRDVLTEIIALTAYIGVTYNIKKFATGPACKAYYKAAKLNFNINAKQLRSYVLDSEKAFCDNKALNALKESEAGKHFLEMEKAVVDFNSKLAEGAKKLIMPKDLYLQTKSVISHITVCTLALTVIPSFCNLLLAPVMKGVKKLQGKEEASAQPAFKSNLSINKVPHVFRPVCNPNTTIANVGNSFNSSMRVGR